MCISFSTRLFLVFLSFVVVFFLSFFLFFSFIHLILIDTWREKKENKKNISSRLTPTKHHYNPYLIPSPPSLLSFSSSSSPLYSSSLPLSFSSCSFLSHAKPRGKREEEEEERSV
ncbi:hypothetical protein CSUI_006810 [Cystoisospora suis]|uniref:Transmembrane protein n=1 Tax=Cystoisospora suis TaxID=483139 RepID=A0A2C6JYD6_9APIC|nr:hypothetical protein CSUI_006810 [Cystoisospora suis]